MGGSVITKSAPAHRATTTSCASEVKPNSSAVITDVLSNSFFLERPIIGKVAASGVPDPSSIREIAA